jgi:hypothetical protein
LPQLSVCTAHGRWKPASALCPTGKLLIISWLGCMFFPGEKVHMRTIGKSSLSLGRVYRTRDLASLSANAPRLAKRLTREGRLMRLAHGLFACPTQSRFGPVPPSDEKVIRVFLDGSPFVFTGPDRWNALGLGSTALYTAPLVYNTKRSGTFILGGRRFILRRVAFPRKPTSEWYIVDLFEHADQAGVSTEALCASLAQALRRKRFDAAQLTKAARAYGSKRTQALLVAVVQASCP